MHTNSIKAALLIESKMFALMSPNNLPVSVLLTPFTNNSN